MEARVERLERQTDALISDVSAIREGVASVGAAVSSADLPGVARASAVQNLREDVGEVKVEVRGLRTRIDWLIGLLVLVIGGAVAGVLLK
mgnify:CR=1 FL=1